MPRGHRERGPRSLDVLRAIKRDGADDASIEFTPLSRD
jgi:hypothetical protein